jgi:hypothetical protein
MSDNHLGFYVAFDVDGKHFAYAVHWKMAAPTDADVDSETRLREEREHRRIIASYRAAARRKGGHVRLLTPEEFQAIVLDNLSSETRAGA